MCPDKKLEWFDPDQAMAVEQLVRQRWSDTYKMSLQAETSLQLNGSPIKVGWTFFLADLGLKLKFSCAQNGLLVGGTTLNNHHGTAPTPVTLT